MNTTVLALIALNVLLLLTMGGGFVYFSRRLKLQRSSHVESVPHLPAKPKHHKCQIMTFHYQHRVTREYLAKTFHSLCDNQPVLDERFGKSHAPAGCDLVECQGSSHRVKA